MDVKNGQALFVGISLTSSFNLITILGLEESEDGPSAFQDGLRRGQW